MTFIPQPGAIEVLERTIREKENELRPLKAQLAQLRQKEAEEKSPIKVGDTIRYEYGRGYREGVVQGLEGTFAPRYLVRPYLKTGELGQAVKVGSWNNPVVIKKAREQS